MNTSDVVKYGNATFIKSVSQVPSDKHMLPGVCGVWSAKDLLAHLVSFEVALVDILQSVKTQSNQAFTFDQNFNDVQVANRKSSTWDQLLREYEAAFKTVEKLITELDLELIIKTGTIPWYGEEYSLDDLIVYQYYGHKREHSAQIDKWLDTTDSCL